MTTDTENQSILEKFKPETSTRFYCASCARDRNVACRVFKVKIVSGRKQRLARCRFCK